MYIKFFLLPIIFFSGGSFLFTQNCLPEGITFERQGQIDSFPINYPGCTIIEGNVCIGSCAFSFTNSIVNLIGLTQLTKIYGTLTIAGNISLVNLDGLENLSVFENDVIIKSNSSLTSIDALNQVQHIKGSFELTDNESIVSINGFDLVDTVVGQIKMQRLFALTDYSAFSNLRYLGGIVIGDCKILEEFPDMLNLEYLGGMSFYYNDKLIRLPALPLLSVIDGDFVIEDNFELPGIFGYENILRINGDIQIAKQMLEARDKARWVINAFHNLTYVGGSLSISQSHSLDTLDAFTQLDTIGGRLGLDLYQVQHNFPQHNRFHFIGDNIYFTYVDSLQDLLCLSELDSLRGGLNLNSCKNLRSFHGIEHITEIGGQLELGFLKIQNLSGLSHITFINGGFRLHSCDSLVDLTGLENVTAINGMLFIFQNDKLESLSGIDNIDPQSIHFGSGTDVIITNNPLLTECNVESICQALRLYHRSYQIHSNGIGCSSIVQILCFDFGLSGKVYYDENQNKIQDLDERGIKHSLVNVDGGTTIATTNSFGQYLAFASEGSQHTLSLDVMDGWILTTDSVSYTRVFNEGSPTNKDNDFGIFPLEESNDLEINLSSGFPRCNTTVDFFLNYLNTGTSDRDGKIVVNYDGDVSFSQAVPAPAMHDVVNHKLTWQFDTLDAYEERNVRIKFILPNKNFEGEFIDFTVEGFIDSSGIEVQKDMFTYSTEIRCAIDPNDKMVTPPGIYDDNYTLKDGLLTYTVRFENEGNAEAIDIAVKDTIDPDLDMSTFKVMNSSFPVFASINGNVVEFFFMNIWLGENKTGFVTYEIRPVDSLEDLTLVENTAGIVFDQNEPIVTNTTLNTLVDAYCEDVYIEIDQTICHGESYLGHTSSGIYRDTIIIGGYCDSVSQINLIVIPTNKVPFDTILCEGQTFLGYGATGVYLFDFYNLFTGCVDTVELTLEVLPLTDEYCITGIHDVNENMFRIYPNPLQYEFFIDATKSIESVKIISLDGRDLSCKEILLNGNQARIELEESTPGGFYLVIITVEGRKYFEKISVCR